MVEEQRGIEDFEAAARTVIACSQALATSPISALQDPVKGEGPVLRRLSETSRAWNPSELADTMGYSRPRMTRILDDLVEKGLAVRSHDERDRRRVLVAATPAGRERACSAEADGIAVVASELELLGDDRAQELVDSMERIWRLMRGAA